MKVSIALASFNGAAYISAQLNSFLTQTRLPDELIISDDCSTDNTVDIIKHFAKNAPFHVSVHKNERNLGYSRNFNEALLRTSGDLVFLCDQDDVWFPEKIETIIAIANNDERSLVLMNDAEITDAELVGSGFTKLGQIHASGCRETSFVMGCCAAIRRDLLNLCLPIPAAFPAHDNWLVGIAIGMGRRRIDHRVLQLYRRHGKSTSQRIINSTKPISKFSRFMDRWNARFRSIRQKTANSSAHHTKLDSFRYLRVWAVGALKSCPSCYVDDIQAYIDFLDRRIAVHESREIVRKLPFPSRLNGVYNYWRGGKYESFSGWESALRDIFFP